MSQLRTVELEETERAVDGPVRPHVDLASEIVRYWWAKRWFIAKVLGVALVLFMGLMLLVPKLYRAEATLMIIPPRFMPEQRPEPLSVGTARNLLGSGELIQQMLARIREAKAVVTALSEEAGSTPSGPDAEMLFTRLAVLTPEQVVNQHGETIRRFVVDGDEATSALAIYLSKLTPAEFNALAALDPDELHDMTVQDLSEALESEDIVEKKTANDVRFSPLLKLFAVSDSGPKAQLLANTWARLFERMYERLTTEKTTAQFESIRKQQQQNQEQLETIQQEIVGFKQTNNLELFQKQIDEFTEDYAEFSRQQSLKESALDSEKGRLAELQRLALSMEYGTRWAGRVDLTLVSALEAQNSNLRDIAAAEGDPSGESTETLALAAAAKLAGFVPPADIPAEVSRPGHPVASGASDAYERIREQTIHSRDKLARAIVELNQFYREQPLQLMEKERDQLQSDYLQALSRYRTGQIRQEVLKTSVRELDEQLSRTQQLLTLNLGVPPEAIANQAARGGSEELRRLTRLEFAREEMNPEWASLAEARSKLVQELELLKSEVENLGQDLPKQELQLRKLQDSIYRVQLSEGFMKQNLERWQNTNRELSDLYVETNNSIANTARQSKLLGVEVINLQESTSRTKAMIEDVQQRYNEAASRLAILESRQRAVQRQGDVLLQKLQDAQIALSGEVSDVSVAASAVAPSRHFFPRRSVFTIVFALFASALLLGFLARERYVELQRQGIA